MAKLSYFNSNRSKYSIKMDKTEWLLLCYAVLTLINTIIFIIFVVSDSIIGRDFFVFALFLSTFALVVIFSLFLHREYSNPDFQFYPLLFYAGIFGCLTFALLFLGYISGLFFQQSSILIPMLDSIYEYINTFEIYKSVTVSHDFSIKTHIYLASFGALCIYMYLLTGLYTRVYVKPTQFIWYINLIIFFIFLLTSDSGHYFRLLSSIGVDTSNIFFLHVYFSTLLTLGFLLTLPFWLKAGFYYKNMTANKNLSPYPMFKELFVGFSIIGLIIYLSYFGLVLNIFTVDPEVKLPWYLLIFAGIKKILPYGNLTLIFAVFPFFIISKLNTSKITNTKARLIFKIFFWFFVVNLVVLAFVGLVSLNPTSYLIGQVATFYYFSFFFIIIPVIGAIDNKLNEKN